MRYTILILPLLAAGCATSNSASPRPEMTTARHYAPAAAAALAFDSPLALAGPMLPLSRDGRSPEAFAGYEQQITTYSYTHQRDEIRHFSPSGDLERQAFTDRTSITTR